jgi:G:T-mismatch repair DNA endonuclease (very short patch repair protein)
MNKIKVLNSNKKRKDIFSKKKRSEIMAAIKSKNTNLEKGVFSFLRKSGCRFSTHRKNVFGKPFLARLAIFKMEE